MHITTSTSDDGVSLRFSGDLDIYAVESVASQLLQVMATAPALTIDLEDVGSCDAAGLQILASARKSATKSGLKLDLRGVSAGVDACLRRLGAEGLFS